MTLKRSLLGGVCLTILLSSTALAQTAPGSGSAAGGTPEPSSTVGEVIVTAQRRSERLQDVPIAVSALSASALATQNVHSLQDLSARVPGFVSTETAGYGGAPLSIRGVGGANGGGEFFSDEPVATYVDGVYVARLSVATADLVDIDSIQVLRGPQGSLYGRDATAGAVVLTTNRPTRDFQAEAQAGGDTLGDYRVEGVISGPLIKDKILARFAAAYNNLGGFGVNVLGGGPVNDGHDLTLRGSVRILPTDHITIDLIAEHFDQHFQPGLFRIAKLTGGPTDSPYVLRPDFQTALQASQYEASENVFNHIQTNAYTLAAEWDARYFTLSSITGYRSFDVDGLADSDNASPSDLTGFPALRSYNDARLRNRQFSQELRIASPSSQKRFTWIAGLYYGHEKNAVDPFEIYNNAAYFKLGTDATFHAFQNSDAAAAYADVSFEILKGLTIRGGGRYSYDQREFDNTQLVETIKAGFSPALHMVLPAGYPVTAPPTFYGKAIFHNFSGRAVIDYKVTSDILTYFSFSQGFKSGGFNALGLTPAYQPETIDAYEVGIKAEALAHRLRVNADAFDYQYDNLQVRLPVPTGGVNIQNAATARVRGAELDTALTPLDGLRFGLNATYLDAIFTSGTLPAVPANAQYAFGASIPLQNVSIVGNTLSRAPKWQVGLTADYQHPINDALKGSIGMSFRYESKTFFLETNQIAPTFQAAGWSELGVHVDVASVNDHWTLSVYGENILDNRHITQITALSAYPQGTLNEPRRFGVRATAKF